jgi:hypothetical protein
VSYYSSLNTMLIQCSYGRMGASCLLWRLDPRLLYLGAIWQLSVPGPPNLDASLKLAPVHYSGPIKIMLVFKRSHLARMTDSARRLGPQIELPSHSSIASKQTGLTTSEAHGKTARVIYQSGDISTSMNDTEYLETGFTDSRHESQWTPSIDNTPRQ